MDVFQGFVGTQCGERQVKTDGIESRAYRLMRGNGNGLPGPGEVDPATAIDRERAMG